MFYTYIIRSINHPSQRYIGSTSDLKSRLAKHNSGEVPHTSRFKPWKVEAYIAFETKEKAAAFEAYLKTGSGHHSPTATSETYNPVFGQGKNDPFSTYWQSPASLRLCRKSTAPSTDKKKKSTGRTTKIAIELEEVKNLTQRILNGADNTCNITFHCRARCSLRAKTRSKNSSEKTENCSARYGRVQ